MTGRRKVAGCRAASHAPCVCASKPNQLSADPTSRTGPALFGCRQGRFLKPDMPGGGGGDKVFMAGIQSRPCQVINRAGSSNPLDWRRAQGGSLQSCVEAAVRLRRLRPSYFICPVGQKQRTLLPYNWCQSPSKSTLQDFCSRHCGPELRVAVPVSTFAKMQLQMMPLAT